MPDVARRAGIASSKSEKQLFATKIQLFMKLFLSHIDSEGGLTLLYNLPDGEMHLSCFDVNQTMDLLYEANMITGSNFYLGLPERHTVDVQIKGITGHMMTMRCNYRLFLTSYLTNNPDQFLKKLITIAKHPNA